MLDETGVCRDNIGNGLTRLTRATKGTFGVRRIIVDTREPWPHPWAEYLPEGFQLERGTLETGDIALSALPEGAVVERKTPADLASCIGSGRERFERELRRGRYVGRLIVAIESGLADVCSCRKAINRQLSDNPLPPSPWNRNQSPWRLIQLQEMAFLTSSWNYCLVAQRN